MNRYLIFMLLTFILLTSFLLIEPVNASLPLSGKIIVVDPGHGGLDPGTLHGNILEKDINLKISLYLEEEVSKLGASVILTREGDYDLSSPNSTWRKRSDFDNRIDLINNSQADLYLSIHLNYLSNAKYYGPQIFYNDNEDLATIIQNDLNSELETDREIKKVPSDTYMYSKLNVTGVLIECGFLSNSDERNNLSSSSYQKKLANIIANSLINYF